MKHMSLALMLIAGCTEAELKARRADAAKSAKEDNARYWKWVEQTLECNVSERLGVCLCVFHNESGIGTTSTSEMGITIAPNEACERNK